MFETIAGAVNGVPCTRAVQKDGANVVTLDDADDGVADTIDVNTDGSGSVVATGGRVAIDGGTTSGRDHFPIPATLIGVPVSAFSNFPFPIGLGGMALWFYIVKRWKFELTATYNKLPTPSTYSNTIHISWSMEAMNTIDEEVSYIDIAKESDLVLPRHHPNVISGSDNADGTNDIEDNDGEGVHIFDYLSDNSDDSFFMELELSTGVPFYKDGLFYPEARFFIERSSNAASNSSYPNEVGTFEIQQPDGTYAGCPVFAQGDTGVVPHIVFTAITARLSPVSYWPYATRGGLPVYDTSTGAVINDPLS